MLVRPYQFRSNRKMTHMEEGFSLVEAMISLVILTIAAAGIGYVLVSSNQQLATLGYVSQSQQCGMASATAMAGSVSCSGAQPVQQQITVSITAASRSSVQLPIASISSSFQVLSNNQQPPSWWQP
jgi:Tfp pilus assembly protein PilV